MILDLQTKKSIKLCQELADAVFAYMRYHNNPDLDRTPFKQTVTKKRLTKAIEEMHEFLHGAGKLVKIKPPDKVLIYKTGSRVVHIIKKD